jgi:spore maturation protein CgeB
LIYFGKSIPLSGFSHNLSGIFIGIRSLGTTSRLRCDALQRTLPDWNWALIDTDAPFLASRRIWRSLAFRSRFGPAVTAINRHVLQNLPAAPVELIWVDKGVCLWPETIRHLRELAKRLIYYTPDTSFLHNQSRFVNRTLALYDLVVTTKSQEVATFQRLIPPDRLLLVTQTYDRLLHYPRCSFADKRPEAVLIGLCEPSREECVATLLDGGIAVRIGGRGWEPFVRRHQRQQLLRYEGSGVFGERYVQLLSSASVGLGLLTHRFLELHTTRTLEIPACGTVLATPRTPETTAMFGDHEALFFDTYTQLAARIQDILSTPERISELAAAGRQRVLAQPWDNDSLVRRIVQNSLR